MKRLYSTNQNLGMWKAFYPWRASQGPAGLQFHFSLINLDLEGNLFGGRKALTMWIRGLIIDSSEELGFRWIPFQHDTISGIRIAWNPNNTKHKQDEFQYWDDIEQEKLAPGNFAITMVIEVVFTLKMTTKSLIWSKSQSYMIGSEENGRSSPTLLPFSWDCSR